MSELDHAKKVLEQASEKAMKVQTRRVEEWNQLKELVGAMAEYILALGTAVETIHKDHTVKDLRKELEGFNLLKNRFQELQGTLQALGKAHFTSWDTHISDENEVFKSFSRRLQRLEHAYSSPGKPEDLNKVAREIERDFPKYKGKLII